MQINSFILSLFWTEIHLELLEREQPETAPMKFLGRPDAYASKFKDAQYFLRSNKPLSLSLPWTPRTKGLHFWTYYTGGVTNINVLGNMAWQRLIPFRASLPVGLKSDVPLSLPLFELFFYPHGIAFGVTLTWEDESARSLKDIIDIAFKMRFGRQYRLTWKKEFEDLYQEILWPEKPDSLLSLDKLAEHGLGIGRILAYGKEAIAGKPTNPEPFSVFTVLKGKDIDLSKAIEGNGSVQKFLHALTEWQPIREGAAALVLDDQVNLGLGEGAGIADMLYGQRRGRAIWYPSRFTNNDPNILYGLQCYHRNIFFASLQTESLYGYARDVVGRLQSGAELSVYQRELASRVGAYLGLLFGGHRDTYRSFSPRRQIQDNDWVEAVNALRSYRGMPPLH